MKKTLEEAAKEYNLTPWVEDSLTTAFIAGAKWQRENAYTRRFPVDPDYVNSRLGPSVGEQIAAAAVEDDPPLERPGERSYGLKRVDPEEDARNKRKQALYNKILKQIKREDEQREKAFARRQKLERELKDLF